MWQYSVNGEARMARQGTAIKGYVWKDGKLVKRQPRLSVSEQIKRRKKPRQKYGKASA